MSPITLPERGTTTGAGHRHRGYAAFIGPVFRTLPFSARLTRGVVVPGGTVA